MNCSFLVVVQYDVDPDIEDAFNDWYTIHAYHMLSVPGYVQACRLVSVLFGPRYATLYQVTDTELLELVYARDTAQRHPVIVADDRLKQQMLPHPVPTPAFAGVYEQIWGPPVWEVLLASNRPLGLVQTDVHDADEAAFNAWYEKEHIPALLKVPGRLAAARLKLTDNPALSRLPKSPRYLVVYQIEDESFIPQMGIPEEMGPEAKAEWDRSAAWFARMTHLSRAYYRPIARFWPICAKVCKEGQVATSRFPYQDRAPGE